VKAMSRYQHIFVALIAIFASFLIRSVVGEENDVNDYYADGGTNQDNSIQYWTNYAIFPNRCIV
jgi:hypothetical protein